MHLEVGLSDLLMAVLKADLGHSLALPCLAASVSCRARRCLPQMVRRAGSSAFHLLARQSCLNNQCLFGNYRTSQDFSACQTSLGYLWWHSGYLQSNQYAEGLPCQLQTLGRQSLQGGAAKPPSLPCQPQTMRQLGRQTMQCQASAVAISLHTVIHQASLVSRHDVPSASPH